MKLISKLVDFIKKVFSKEQYKMIESGEIESKQVDEKVDFFREQLKVDATLKTMVESDICVGNGLGFHGKIKG